MTTTTSNKIRNFRFQTLRCGFFSIEYRSENVYEKIVENVKEKSNEIDSKCKNEKMVKILKKNDRKNMKKDNKKLNEKMIKRNDRKLNVNCKCNQKKIKLDGMKIGLNIVEQIVKIGSALSGLLPSIRYTLVRHAELV